MREARRTTRERMLETLREGQRTPSELAREFDIQTSDAMSHLRHIARSTDPTADSLLVAPPRCRECGFDGFDDLLNRPSRCPECKSENLAEPVVTVD